MGNELIKKKKYNDKQIELLRRTIAKDCTEDEFFLGMNIVKKYELDPFAGEVYFAKIQGAVKIIVGRDGFLALANREPDFEGMRSGVIYKDSIIEFDEKGNVKDGFKTEFLTLPRDHILGAWATCKRKGRATMVELISMLEFDKANEDAVKNNYKLKQSAWYNFPREMAKAKAERSVLKKTYSLSGLTTKEDVSYETQNELLNVTPKAEVPKVNLFEKPIPEVNIDPEHEKKEKKPRKIKKEKEAEKPVLSINDELKKILADMSKAGKRSAWMTIIDQECNGDYMAIDDMTEGQKKIIKERSLAAMSEN